MSMKLVRATGVAPAQSASQAEMLTVTSRPWEIHENRLALDGADRFSLGVNLLLANENENEIGALTWTCTMNPLLRTERCRTLTP
jgi:hypothetical protein